MELLYILLFFLTLMSVAGFEKYAFASVFGIALVVICIVLERKTTISKRIIFTVPTVTSLILFLAFYKKVINGFFLFLNAVFERSQATQSYEYDMLPSTSVSSGFCLLITVALCSTLISFAFILLSKKGKVCLSILLFIMLCAFFEYFGILPNEALFLAYFICFVLECSYKISTLTLVRVIIPSVIIITLCFAFAGENTSVSKMDDMLRDKLSFNTVYYENNNNTNESEEPEEPKIEDKENDKSFDFGFDIQFTGTTMILAFAAIIIIFMFIVSILSDMYKKKVEKLRFGIDSKNNSEAIHFMYLYAIKWLEVHGVNFKNSKYELDNSKLQNFDSGYEEKYIKATELWKESTFSNHTMSKSQRSIVLDFLKQTEKEILKNSKLLMRLKIKLKYKLREEDKE